MKRLLLLFPVLLASCTMPEGQDAATASHARSGNEVAVIGVLERNCVHCHGEGRLTSMPPINDTHAISKLIGSHWIVPGRPEASRFYQVVTFPDEVPGAMPPSGHAISKKDARTLHQGIKDGARLPSHNVTLTPRGPLPRSI